MTPVHLKTSRPKLFIDPKDLKSKRQQISRILSEDIEGRGVERSMHLKEAAAIKICREPYKATIREEVKGKWKKIKKPFYKRECKKSLCPYCQVQKAKQDFRRLHTQFEAFDLENLYTLRLTLDTGNIGGDDLSATRELLLERFDELAKQPEWQVFVRSGGAVHTAWEPASEKYAEGYCVHLHLICAASTTPNREAVSAAIERTLRIPRRRMKDCFFFEPVENLARKVSYITRVCNLIPGYPKPVRDHLDERVESPWLLPRITDEDIRSFKRDRFRRHRLVLRNHDAAIDQYLKHLRHIAWLARNKKTDEAKK